MKTIDDIEWSGKIAVVRTDLNVPLTADGGIRDDTRIKAAVPTLLEIIDKGGGAVVLSHLGRPQEGKPDPALSLLQLKPALEEALDYSVRFCPRLDNVRAVPGEIVLLENVRFNKGEKINDDELVKRYAALGKVFVIDAFATAHRDEASVSGIAMSGIPVCAGKLFARELTMLMRVMEHAEHPMVGIFGGSKISTKMGLLRRMVSQCDTLIIGGGIANTVLVENGVAVGDSLIEEGMHSEALLLHSCPNVVLPLDVIVESDGQPKSRELTDIQSGEKIYDIGEKTQKEFARIIADAKTIIWNGPVGLYEKTEYAAGSMALASAIASSPAFSLIGGGDTIAAASATGVLERLSYVCTGGGAMVEYLAGTRLPVLEALLH